LNVLRFAETIRPLLLAPLGSVVIHAVWIVTFQRPALSASLFILLAIIYGMSLAAGLLFVLPIFALVPALRQPGIWLALSYGAFIAISSAVLVGGSSEVLRWQVVTGYGSAGAAAGIVYALAARRDARQLRCEIEN
jgi:hypothetical protein